MSHPNKNQAELFDLGFAEHNVLACNRIIFFKFHLAGVRTSILFRDVEVTGIRRGNETDFDNVGLGHSFLSRASDAGHHARGWCSSERKMRIQEPKVKYSYGVQAQE
ncbi:50S ribosomal protein L33 [Acetobacter orientalis]|uniref:50S ribosomal protein L33 n=1 Tax=Acetobacter orientalis TaxID=146474 RepID=A0A2Z5ZCX0_9PROT|nr:50S ribosomal protein L33 [Acetobacter orientalis]